MYKDVKHDRDTQIDILVKIHVFVKLHFLSLLEGRARVGSLTFCCLCRVLCTGNLVQDHVEPAK